MKNAAAARSEATGVTAEYVVEQLRTVVEDLDTPASARVTALTTLARHLGMLTDKHEVTSELVVQRLICMGEDGVTPLECSKIRAEPIGRPDESPDQIVHQPPQLPPADMESGEGA